MGLFIHCYVTKEDAIMLGTTRAGDFLLPLADEALAPLSEAERRMLTGYVVHGTQDKPARGSLALKVVPTLDVAIQRIKDMVAEADAKAEAEKAKAEQRIAEALAAPDDKWIRTSYGRPEVMDAPGIHLTGEEMWDPRIKARREQVARDVLPAMREAYDKAEAEREASREKAKEAAKLAREMEEAQAEDEARCWIAAHGSSRLKAIVAAGLLDNSMGVYRDERLAAERPGWEWLAKFLDGGDGLHEDEAGLDRINPDEEEVTALLDCRKSFPDEYIALRWFEADLQPHGPWLVSRYLDRLIGFSL